uniref:GATA-type domain-containing protein n=1 Tax=Caenorhabditis tropicalis TaxID=1561998 RepID=A0A1I7U1J8_9PELO
MDAIHGSPMTQSSPASSPPSQRQSISASSNRPSRKCTVCSITETCKWRNVRSNDGILCNACFIYQRKYDSTRPDKAQNNYKKRKEDKNKMKSVNK